MKKNFIAMTVVGFLSVLGASGWAQTSMTSTPAATHPMKQNLEGYFSSARVHFQKDNHAAARDIRNAAQYLDKEAKKATHATKPALEMSAQELEKLAADVQAGLVTDPAKLEAVFSKAHEAHQKRRNS